MENWLFGLSVPGKGNKCKNEELKWSNINVLTKVNNPKKKEKFFVKGRVLSEKNRSGPKK